MMSDPLADNPFTQVYNKLWDLVEAHQDINDRVRLGNRIKFGEDNRTPWKENVATKDLPELILVQDATAVRMQITSSTSSIIREYSWLISCGDFRYNHFLNPVEWLLITAHTGWKSQMASLTYNGKTFVKRSDFIGATTGATDPDRNRSIQGWSSIWRLQIEMHFDTADLQGEI